MTALRRPALLALMLISCGDAQEDVDLLKGALFPNAPRFHPRAQLSQFLVQRSRR